MSHLTDEEALGLADGTLAGAGCHDAAGHARGCPDCLARVALARQMLDEATGTVLPHSSVRLVTAAGRSPARPPRLAWRPVTALAAVAALVVALVWAGLHWQSAPGRPPAVPQGPLVAGLPGQGKAPPQLPTPPAPAGNVEEHPGSTATPRPPAVRKLEPRATARTHPPAAQPPRAAPATPALPTWAMERPGPVPPPAPRAPAPQANDARVWALSEQLSREQAPPELFRVDRDELRSRPTETNELPPAASGPLFLDGDAAAMSEAVNPADNRLEDQ